MYASWPELIPKWTAADYSTIALQTAFDSVWQQGCHGYFQNQQGKTLGFSYWQPAHAKAAILLVPGRIETVHKYLELIADATAAGYQVYALDHQGQGRSERLSQKRQLGDVVQFQHYIDDLHQFIQTIVQPQLQLPCLAISHSMGSAILTRYLQQSPQHLLSAAIFSSPMWGIQTSPLSPAAALILAQLMQWVERNCSRDGWFIPGQSAYRAIPFAENTLTGCEARYRWFRQLYQDNPEYQLGGISWRWLWQALRACEQIAAGPALDLPCLLLQAQADQIVSNSQQSLIWQQWQAAPNAHPANQHVLLADARHELLAETDAIRQRWYQQLNRFTASVPYQAAI